MEVRNFFNQALFSCPRWNLQIRILTLEHPTIVAGSTMPTDPRLSIRFGIEWRDTPEEMVISW